MLLQVVKLACIEFLKQVEARHSDTFFKKSIEECEASSESFKLNPDQILQKALALKSLQGLLIDEN